MENNNISYFCAISKKWVAQANTISLILYEGDYCNDRYNYNRPITISDFERDYLPKIAELLEIDIITLKELLIKDNENVYIKIDKVLIDDNRRIDNRIRLDRFRNYTLNYCLDNILISYEYIDDEELVLTQATIDDEVSSCRWCEHRCFSNDMEYSERTEEYYCCSDCLCDHESDEGYRDDDESDDYVSGWQRTTNTNSKLYRSKKAIHFGIELEFKLENYNDIRELADELPKDFGLVADGSVSNGFEIVSPIMAGKKGLKAIKTITDLLKKYNARVDSQCGFHLHISGKDLVEKPINTDILKKLIAIYMNFEDVLLSFLPRSRQTNSYCKKISNDYSLIDLVEKNISIDDIEKSYYKTTDEQRVKEQKSTHYSSFRYYGLNLHSLFAEKHYEIRYHSGTVNHDKIVNWIKLHLAIKKIATDTTNNFDRINEQLKCIDFIKKTKALYELVKLPKKTQVYFNKRQKLFSQNRQLQEVN